MKPKAFENDTCVFCGKYVPEGQQVCPECEKATENKLKVSEALMIGIDIGDGDDISVLQVVRCSGNKREVINAMYGAEAEWTYQHLVTNRHHHIDKIPPARKEDATYAYNQNTNCRNPSIHR